MLTVKRLFGAVLIVIGWVIIWRGRGLSRHFTQEQDKAWNVVRPAPKGVQRFNVYGCGAFLIVVGAVLLVRGE